MFIQIRLDMLDMRQKFLYILLVLKLNKKNRDAIMNAITPHYSKEEFARRGDELYERNVRPNIDINDEGKFVVIDIDTGDYEIDIDELDAYDRLISSHPEAQVWVMQVGSRYARRFGPRYQSVAI